MSIPSISEDFVFNVSNSDVRTKVEELLDPKLHTLLADETLMAAAGDKKKNKKQATASAKPVPAKPVSTAARLAQERLAAVKAAEEKAKAEEADRKRKEDEEDRILAEIERKKAEEKARKKEKERLKKQTAIKEGTYLSKKQKEDLEKARARLGVKVDADSTASDTEDASPKKLNMASMYDNKKKKTSTSSTAIVTDTSIMVVAPASVGVGMIADSWEDAASAVEAAAAATISKSGASKSVTANESTGNTGTKCLEDRINESRARRKARRAAAEVAMSKDRLRSPIAVVLGHVDTGKTSLLDRIRKTNVQEGEAGGITQQIGASYFPIDRLRTATDKLASAGINVEYKVPGLLIMDTPGHEQFSNLRSRGTGLCDIAVLVIDITAGLERQTVESIELLRARRTPFVVALNKVDRMYGWKANPNMPFRETLASQPDYAQEEFKTKAKHVLTQLAEKGLNANLYYENDDFRRNVSVIPTSAHTGEGIPDLLSLLVQLTQQMMSNRLMFINDVQCTVLEVKAIDGLGTTIDVVLVNGELNEGDTIVVCGMEGPIVTQIRALLTPPPLQEMRVKTSYVHHKRIEAAMGVKISAQGLDKAVVGTSLIVLHPDDEIEDLKEEVMKDYHTIMKGFKRDPVGVFVQASTLGSLEALLGYLRNHEPPIPVASVGIGPLHKKDITMASVMLEHKKEYAAVLAFDVKITPEAAAAAEHLGVKLFSAEIIYHLTDQFDKYLKANLAAKQSAAEAVFPVIARIIPTAVFNKRGPIVLGVDVLEGTLRIGTPLCVILPTANVMGSNILTIGKVDSIELNHVQVKESIAGGPSVAVKIVPANDEQTSILYGRHFDHNQTLYACINRSSIDVLKESFRDEMSKENWKTIIKLKDILGVD